MNHDVPDTAPDGQARREPIPISGYRPFFSATPCPNCGRSAKTHLTLAEARERHGYGRTDCLACRLTDLRRAK